MDNLKNKEVKINNEHLNTPNFNEINNKPKWVKEEDNKLITPIIFSNNKSNKMIDLSSTAASNLKDIDYSNLVKNKNLFNELEFKKDLMMINEKNKKIKKKKNKKKKKYKNSYSSEKYIKGTWTNEEDKKLLDLISKYGAKNWSSIAKNFPTRIGKQCRERWHNHLNPFVIKKKWSKQEDKILLKLHKKYGNKWAKIAKHIPGRTDNNIKNHWNSTIKRKFKLGNWDEEILEENNEQVNKLNDYNNPEIYKIMPIFNFYLLESNLKNESNYYLKKINNYLNLNNKKFELNLGKFNPLFNL